MIILANTDNNNAEVADILPDAIANEEVEDVISYLLNNGADINAVDNYNQTPLNYAAVKGNVCLLYTSPSPRDQRGSRMPSSA